MAETRAQARQAVLSGRVLVSGSPAEKPGRLVAADEAIAFTTPQAPFVGRGGTKLAGALDRFGIDVSGARCLDLGASTGGFTDCLLQRGASGVVAVDVGTNQLHYRLRTNPRVTVLERTDVRDLDASAVGDVDLVVCDLSFISLRTVMADIARLAGDAWVLLLVKPQFEVGRENVGKGGIVRDAVLHARAVEGVVAAAEEHGLRHVDDAESPITGSDGNREFFVLLNTGGYRGGSRAGSGRRRLDPGRDSRPVADPPMETTGGYRGGSRAGSGRRRLDPGRDSRPVADPPMERAHP